MLLYKRKVSEKIAGKTAQKNPDGCSCHIVAHEAGVVHPSHSGYEGGECADHRHEAGDEDGLFAMLLEKGMGLFQVALAEQSGIGPVE